MATITFEQPELADHIVSETVNYKWFIEKYKPQIKMRSPEFSGKSSEFSFYLVLHEQVPGSSSRGRPWLPVCLHVGRAGYGSLRVQVVCTLSLMSHGFEVGKREFVYTLTSNRPCNCEDLESTTRFDASLLRAEAPLVVLCYLTVYCHPDNDQPYQKLTENPDGTLLQDFSDLLHTGRLSDVTISVQGHSFQAHKLLLAARSPVFAAMFEHDMKEREVGAVEVVDVDREVFAELLRYIYTDRVASLDQVALRLLSAADKYDLLSLKQMCERSLRNGLSLENVISVLIAAHLHNCDRLKRQAINFIADNIQHVVATDEWVKKLMDYPTLIKDVTRVFSSLIKKSKRRMSAPKSIPV